MAGRQKDKERVFNISVVGLSGTDKEKGSVGVGKSCLCNRFIRPQADDYHKEHICVISQSDFSGRVVNNDHFLYWGERKLTYEGQTYSFRIIEQTEFIDDSSFQPFRGNNTGNYLKRCVSVKFGSQDKLMYSCKDQLGDEDNYPKSTFTNGKITIDGFLIVYDSSRVRGRDAEKQIDFLTSLYNLLKKTNKAFVIAVTKCDEAHEYNMSEIDRFSQRHKIQLIETSANEAVNVDLAFVTLVQMIDKSRGTGKRVVYHEANKQRKLTIDKVTESFSAILRDNITNYHLKWNTMKRFEHDQAYEEYIYHLGTKEARKLFERHIKTLKTNHQRRMLLQYVTTLPSVFDDILPDLVTIGQRGWSECKQVIKEHEHFGKWFIVLDGDWQEHPHINQTIDTRIPASIFTTHDLDCESQFKNHLNKLSAAKRKERMQSDFRKLLEASKQEVMAGKLYKDVIKHFNNEESFQELSNDECLEIYNSHQEQITRQAKDDFKELLFESADFFAKFDDVKLSHNDLLDIQDKLQSDARYTALEFLHNDRHALLIKHLAFIQHPTPETCISGERCMDLLINGHIANAVHRTSAPSSIQSCDDEFQKLNIVILGQEGLAEELLTVIESQCCDREYTLDGRLHNLQLRAVEGDVSQIQNGLKTEQFTPAACICTFSGRESFDYVKSSLEKTILNQESDKELRKLPVVFLFARGVLVQDDEHNEIKEEAQMMSTRLSSTKFVDMPKDDSMLMRGNKFHEQQIQQAIRAILGSTQTPNPHEQTNGQCLMETLKIGLCIMCGDEYSVEHVLSPFVKNDLCYRNPNTDGVFNVITYIDDKKAKVEIRASSYHGAAKYASQCHGLILFYSPKRKGSFETMKNFAVKYDFLETKIVAVCDTDKVVKHFELTKSGEEFAQRIDAGFTITGADFDVQTEAFSPFFQEVMLRKNDTDDSESESEHDLDYINTRPPLPTPGSINYQQDGRKNAPPTDENSRSTQQEINTQDAVENENHEKDLEEDDTNKSHSEFMAKLKMWEDRFSDIENSSPTVHKPSSIPTSTPDRTPEPIYDVVNPTVDDDPVCYPPREYHSEERIYSEVQDVNISTSENQREQQKPKPIPPPVKPQRFFPDKDYISEENSAYEGLDTYPRDDDYFGEYKEEENPIYIAASKLPPPPVKPKPTDRTRQKAQPRKLDMEKFHDIEQVVGNNLVVRTPQSQRGAPHSHPIATPEGYAVPHDVLHMPVHISAGAIYHEPVDAIQGSKVGLKCLKKLLIPTKLFLHWRIHQNCSSRNKQNVSIFLLRPTLQSLFLIQLLTKIYNLLKIIRKQNKKYCFYC
ncbi:rho GTPase-activating protein 35-like isoform X5 [Anneissia japonica]|uniref:rho GTPase-activating protein 35-like isoform X5 n=1 Tax=Anneissia japonica TaxID=1529436 RepID=UPI001425B55F|nr:rho GTPase-activating protein 35-like isoform X5 [Anneissia japonica]